MTRLDQFGIPHNDGPDEVFFAHPQFGIGHWIVFGILVLGGIIVFLYFAPMVG